MSDPVRKTTAEQWRRRPLEARRPYQEHRQVLLKIAAHTESPRCFSGTFRMTEGNIASDRIESDPVTLYIHGPTSELALPLLLPIPLSFMSYSVCETLSVFPPAGRLVTSIIDRRS